MNKKKSINFFIFLIILAYIFIGTGLHGDDLLFIKKYNNLRFLDFIFPNLDTIDSHILTFPSYYYLFIFYWLIGDSYQFVYDILKIFYILISLFFYYKFFTLFFDTNKSFIFSLFIIFYPSHDTTLFWYVTSSYNLIPSLILYSYYLFINKINKTAIFILLFSTFSFYISLPFVFGLSFFLLLKKKNNLFLIYFITGMIYVIYVNTIFFFYENLDSKSSDINNIIIILSSLLLQFFSSIEAVFGPSIIFKIIGTYYNLSLTDLIISIFVIIIITFNTRKFTKFNIQKYLDLSTIILMIYFSSIIYISLTNSYYHTAYNLGNRITIYPTLLIVIILSLIKNKFILLCIFYFFIVLPLLGIGNHWKEWNKNQISIIYNINKNIDIANLRPDDTLIIEGSRYSVLNGINHIEFLAMPWITETILSKYDIKNVISLSKNLILKENILINKKFKKTYELHNKIFIYKTNIDKVIEVDQYELSNLILNTKYNKRHWLQKLDKDNIIIILINKLNPSIQNVFK